MRAMGLDAGRVLRLKEMVDSVLASGGEGSRALQAKSLSEAYSKLRSEAREVAESKGVAEEFDRLFQDLAGDVGASNVSSSGFDPFKSGSYANEAAAALAQLSGWLNGLLVEARMMMEAEAYAAARLQNEA